MLLISTHLTEIKNFLLKRDSLKLKVPKIVFVWWFLLCFIFDVSAS